MKASLRFSLFIGFIIFSFFILKSQAFSVETEPQQTSTVVSADNITQNDSPESKKEDHQGGMEPLFFIVVALLLGAAAKHFLKKSPVPYQSWSEENLPTFFILYQQHFVDINT